MEYERLAKYINARLEQLGEIDSSKNKDLENRLIGQQTELLRLAKMLYNDGTVRIMTEEGIKIEQY